MITYKVIRVFFRTSKQQTIKRGLTLEAAQVHCQNPENDSRTATSLKAIALTRQHGAWFDEFIREQEK